MKRIKEENKKRYVADFETAEDLDDLTYVWAWAVCDCETLNSVYGTNIESFLNYIFTLKDQSVVYFHNLKFDQTFTLVKIIGNGWKQTTEKPAKMKNKEYKAITSGLGQAYSLILKNKGKIIYLYDSLKKIPFKVEEIAKALDFDEQKGKINYKEHRDEGGELSKDDKDYLRRDVEIIAKAMKLMFFDNDLYKLTIGSDCMNYFKTNCCKNFKTIFPILDLETDSFIRNAFNGGLCMVNKKYVGRYIKNNGRTYDYNSMYPSQMHSSSKNKFPFGEPKYYTGKYENDKDYPLYVQRIKVIFDLKKDHIPTVQIKNNSLYKPNEFIETSYKLPIELTMTNIDLELFKEQYDIYAIEYIDGYKFHGALGLFDKYINHFYEMKENATKTGDRVERQLSKLFLNNLYGKFGTSPKSSYMKYNTDNEVLKRKAIKEGKESVYVPVAAFTTAYARRELITAAQSNYDRWLYMDTDSLHLLGDEEAKNIKIDDTALGAWKMESKWSEAKFLRQKTYAEKINDEWNYKCAGLPQECKEKLNIEDFYLGAVIPGKLMSKQVKGGTKLVETTFEIKKI